MTEVTQPDSVCWTLTTKISVQFFLKHTQKNNLSQASVSLSAAQAVDKTNSLLKCI